MLYHRFFLILALGLLTLSTAACGADEVSVNFQKIDGVCDVDGFFNVTADCSTAWDVLTDYDQMRHFVSGLKRSHLEEYSGKGRFLVEQEFEGGFLFVTKRVRVSLAVCETRWQSILFEDVGHKDFEFYKGSWELQHEPNGQLKITYALKARQNLNEPFAGNYMKDGIQNLLDSIQKEILRRQALCQRPAEPLT
jgi:hypothetical protein